MEAVETEPVSTKQILTTMAERPDLLVNALMGRNALLEKFLDGRRDIDTEAGYPKEITAEHYAILFRRELGKRVVSVYPEESWRVLPEIYEDADKDTETAFEASLAALEKRLHLMQFLQRADVVSGIGSYGLILWGLDDGLALREPVEGWESWAESTGRADTEPRAEGTKRRLLYIRVFDETAATIDKYVTDPTNPRFGLPEYYNVRFADLAQSGAVGTGVEEKVHWTRVTHLADNRLTSEVCGMPRMEPVYNRLYDLRKILGGSGEMFFKGGFPGISLETHPNIEDAELDEEKTRKMIYDYQNGLQRYLATTGMTAKSLAPQIADPTAHWEVQIKSICIQLEVPYRVFVGIEGGVVTGDQTTKAWNARLKNRRERYVTPLILDLALSRLVAYGVLEPTAEPEGWSVMWPPLEEQSEEAQAKVAATKTDALAKYVGGSVETLIPPMEFFTLILGLDDDVAEAIIDAAVTHIEDGALHAHGELGDDDEAE